LKQRHKEKGKGNHAFTYTSFEEFVECALRGTVTDKANALFHFSFPKHDTVTAQNLYEETINQTLLQKYLLYIQTFVKCPLYDRDWNCIHPYSKTLFS
jgi:hypothetical protein